MSWFDAFVAGVIHSGASPLVAAAGELENEAEGETNTVPAVLGWAYRRNFDVFHPGETAEECCKAVPRAYLQRVAYAYRRPDSSVVGASQATPVVDDLGAWVDGAAAPGQHLAVAAKAPSHQRGPSSCR